MFFRRMDAACGPALLLPRLVKRDQPQKFMGSRETTSMPRRHWMHKMNNRPRLILACSLRSYFCFAWQILQAVVAGSGLTPGHENSAVPLDRLVTSPAFSGGFVQQQQQQRRQQKQQQQQGPSNISPRHPTKGTGNRTISNVDNRSGFCLGNIVETSYEHDEIENHSIGSNMEKGQVLSSRHSMCPKFNLKGGGQSTHSG